MQATVVSAAHNIPAAQYLVKDDKIGASSSGFAGAQDSWRSARRDKAPFLLYVEVLQSDVAAAAASADAAPGAARGGAAGQGGAPAGAQVLQVPLAARAAADAAAGAAAGTAHSDRGAVPAPDTSKVRITGPPAPKPPRGRIPTAVLFSRSAC